MSEALSTAVVFLFYMKKFLISDYNQLCDMTQYELTYSSAVRAKCKECCGFSTKEAMKCDCKTCALYPAKMRFINRDAGFKKRQVPKTAVDE